jgi:hypothetical protein
MQCLDGRQRCFCLDSSGCMSIATSWARSLMVVVGLGETGWVIVSVGWLGWLVGSVVVVELLKGLRMFVSLADETKTKPVALRPNTGTGYVISIKFISHSHFIPESPKTYTSRDQSAISPDTKNDPEWQGREFPSHVQQQQQLYPLPRRPCQTTQKRSETISRR